VVTVEEAMTRRPISVAPAAPLETAMSVMRERRIRHLPVVDDGGRLVGVVSDRDMRSIILAPAVDQFLAAETRRYLSEITATLHDIPVSQIMTSPVVTTTPQAPLAQAAAVMHQLRIGCLPVLSGTELIGIVTDRDVLRGLAATLPAIRGEDPDSYLP
jgi:acetoin utilization protein AcuB